GSRRLRIAGRALAQRKAQAADRAGETRGRCEAAGACDLGSRVLTKRKVVLFYPPYDGEPLSAPLCLLSLAAPLLQNGFDVKIIDGAMVPDWESRVLREVQGALCLGISVLTGPMIRGAMRVGKLVKHANPEVPVILGGWHPSLLPGQTLNERWVDAIVRG